MKDQEVLPIQLKSLAIIDDNPIDRLLVREAVTGFDSRINIIEFSSGLHFIEWIKQKDRAGISIIFMDMNMPKMNGIETVEQLQQLDEIEDIEVIIISGTSDLEELEQIRNQTSCQYMCKPLDFFTLEHQVCLILENHFSNISIIKNP